MSTEDREALKAERLAVQRERRVVRSRRTAPVLAADAAALVPVPGPPLWSRERVEHALRVLDGEPPTSPEEQLEAGHDAWCADVVDRAERARERGRSVSDDELGVDADDWPAVVAGAERHRASRADAEAFTAWAASTEPALREQVERTRRERREVREAQGRLAALRSDLAVLGAAHVRQLRQLSEMAVLYGSPRPTRETGREEDSDGLSGRERARRYQEEATRPLDALVAEVAPALGWTERSARRVVAMALLVTTAMPRALELLEAGAIALAQLQVVVDRLVEAEAVVTEQVDEVLFGPGGSGHGLTSAQLRTEADAVLHRLDADAVRRRSRRRVRARDVAFRSLGDGIAQLVLTGPAPALAAAHRSISAVAAANLAEARTARTGGREPADGGDPYAEQPAPGEPAPDVRGIGAHRFDASMTALSAARPAALGADAAGWAAPVLEVHLALSGAVGVDDEPGHLAGYGWVPAWLVRQGLTWRGCRLRRVLTDPFTGDLITVDGHTFPASWLTDPGDPDDPAGGSAEGPAGPDPGDPPPPDPPRTWKGLPVQDLPPPRTEDDVLGDPLPDDEFLDGSPDDHPDACSAGTCTPVGPDTCPAPLGGYRPPAALDRWVRRRWGTCTAPGSTVPADRSDLDHVVPFRAGGVGGDGGGGSTCSCNLEPKSRRAHLRKHAGDRPGSVHWSARWQQHRCSQGSSHWRSPLGVDHVTRPALAAQPVPRFRPTTWPPSHLDARYERLPDPAPPAAPQPAAPFPDEPPF